MWSILLNPLVNHPQQSVLCIIFLAIHSLEILLLLLWISIEQHYKHESNIVQEIMQIFQYKVQTIIYKRTQLFSDGVFSIFALCHSSYYLQLGPLCPISCSFVLVTFCSFCFLLKRLFIKSFFLQFAFQCDFLLYVVVNLISYYIFKLLLFCKLLFVFLSFFTTLASEFRIEQQFFMESFAVVQISLKIFPLRFLIQFYQRFFVIS